MRYRVNQIKPVSNARRYEFLMANGVIVHGGACGPGGSPVVMKGSELNDFIDEAIWRATHPGQNPIREWGDGVQEEREVVGRESDRGAGEEAGRAGAEGESAVGGGVARPGVLRARRKTADNRVQATGRKAQRKADSGDRPTKGA